MANVIHQCFYTVNILIKIDKKISWKIITLFKLKNNTLKTLVQKKKMSMSGAVRYF